MLLTLLLLPLPLSVISCFIWLLFLVVVRVLMWPLFSYAFLFSFNQVLGLVLCNCLSAGRVKGLWLQGGHG